jgi:L,D-peptidoglycan transpeptidase YkuD (ErfK/YbiS/YcfS/YnhG family)
MPPVSLIVTSPVTLQLGERTYPCVIGRNGIITDKTEGDGATPRGSFPLRRVYYRADRVTLPEIALPCDALSPQDGWCDDPAHPAYNTHVMLPFPARHEELWRDDHAYDVIVVLGVNDGPVVAGKGSAIFMHLMHDDNRPTAGCVSVSLPHMLEILPRLSAASMIEIQ